jgi:UDP-glucose 4-epimerase
MDHSRAPQEVVIKELAPILDSYQGVQVLVLGATGFIGRWVTRYLCLSKAVVFAVVKDEAKASQVFRRYGINARTVKADLSNLDTVLDILERCHPEIVFNLAGYGVNPAERDERLAYLLNASLVEEICSWMRKHLHRNWKGQSLIHVGSALEYGNISGDLSEDSLPRPTTLYGKSKLAGSQIVRELGQFSDIKCLTARLFTVYGPGEHLNRLLPSLIRVAQTGESLPLTAGLQKRDFTYIEDIAEGLLRLGLSVGRPGEIVNLATGELHEVREFVKIAAQILSIVQDKLLFNEIPTRSEEMQHDPVNIDRLGELTQWYPDTSIQEGILRTKQFAVKQVEN